MKLYAYLAAAVILAGLLGYGIHIVRQANRAEAAEEALEKAQERFAADVSRLTKAAETNRQIASDLATFRGEQSAATQAFHVELAKRNITREIRYVTKDGVEAVCTQRDPVRYHELFNRAVTGATNP